MRGHSLAFGSLPRLLLTCLIRYLLRYHICDPQSVPFPYATVLRRNWHSSGPKAISHHFHWWVLTLWMGWIHTGEFNYFLFKSIYGLCYCCFLNSDLVVSSQFSFTMPPHFSTQKRTPINMFMFPHPIDSNIFFFSRLAVCFSQSVPRPASYSL